MYNYSSNLSDSQWQVIKKYLKVNRKRKYDLRGIVNGVLYLVKTGCQWRMIPRDFPKWQIIYYYFKKWKMSGVIESLQQFLVKKVRQRLGRKSQPSVGIIDSQSVKSTLVSSKAHTGFDGGKRIKGIKRHIVVDTLGLLLNVVVHSAAMADRKGSYIVLDKLKRKWPRINKIFADGGYPLPGRADQRIQQLMGYEMEVIKRNQVNTFKVIPKRWIVERTFAWLDTNRRNAKSYERYPCSAQAIAQISAIRMMLKHF